LFVAGDVFDRFRRNSECIDHFLVHDPDAAARDCAHAELGMEWHAEFAHHQNIQRRV
jgi:hypothetical protein